MSKIWLPQGTTRQILALYIIISFFLIFPGVSENPDSLTSSPFSIYFGDNFTSQSDENMPSLFSVSDNFAEPASQLPVEEVFSEEEAFSRPYADSAILVMFDPRSDSLPMRIHSTIGAEIIHDYSDQGVPGLELVSPPEQLSVEEAVEYYQTQPGVMYAEPDYYRFSSRIPSDPDFWRQWGLHNTGQVYRENILPGTPGSDLNASAAWDTITGGDPIVAVIDSGVDYLHPDLIANVLTDPTNGTAGYDAITGEMEAMDLASHGTHCAGVIGAVGDNALGITGVNWHSRILPIRFLNSFGTGTVSDEIESILWATSNGARIISCSYGGSGYSRAEYEVMKSADALFVCAAGNNENNNDIAPYYPCSLDLPNIISVAATDASDNLATFSNYGVKSVDIGAPGVEIYSTKHNTYRPDPLWTDPFDNLYNWTGQGNWTLDTVNYVSPNSSVAGLVNRSAPDSSASSAVLTLKSPLSISGMSNPVISYQWSFVAVNYSFSIEGSNNGISWYPLEYGKGGVMITPYMKRECKIPIDLREGHFFIRFVADGEFCLIGLDDIMLSDGYGELVESRWGYMDGSSMACPHVSGMAALLAAAAPDASVSDIRSAILATATPVSSLAGKTVTGGRVDLAKALERITGGSSYHLRLQPGWNHVSVPYRLISGNDTAQEVFGSLSNVSGHSLYRFESGDWNVVHQDERIIPLTSYWIFTGSKASLPLMVESDQSGFFTRNLTTGWNGFGIIGERAFPAKTVLNPLSDLWSYVIGFNASTQMSDEPIIRGGSGTQNESRELNPYLGYWIYMTRNGTYEKNQTLIAG